MSALSLATLGVLPTGYATSVATLGLFSTELPVEVPVEEGNGTARPFRRIAVVPEVVAEMKALAEVLLPTVVVPSGEGIRPVYERAEPAPATQFTGYRPAQDNVVELTRKITLPLPQFDQAVTGEVAAPLVGVAVSPAQATMTASGDPAQATTGATAPQLSGATYAYRTVLLPETVRNPTDEMLAVLLTAFK